MTTTWAWKTQGDGQFEGGVLSNTIHHTGGIVIPPGSSLQRVIARGDMTLTGSFTPGSSLVSISPYLFELHYYLTGVGPDRKPIYDTSFAPVVTAYASPLGDGTVVLNCQCSTGPIYFDAESRAASPPPPADAVILNWELYVNPLFGPSSQNTAWMSQLSGYLWTQYLTSTATP